ncbi:MAG TPA: tetratricopeptide repeat protein, partial [Anaeromyxobacteraceae bacterium]|nr:tetratricopeptide repeat protein [Anaeromyxobacteraceae bacterium]
MNGLLRRAWIPVLLAALLPFAQTLPNPPVLDDGWAVVDNPLVQGGMRNAARILTSPYNYGGPGTTGGLFRPVTTLTFAANYAVHGRAPFGYHLVNLLLHVVASLLVLSLARRLAEATMPDRAPWVALVAGLLFAVHPVHVEAIAPIVGRKELLSTALVLAAMLTAFSGRGAARSVGRLAATVGLGALAILSNEGAAVLPLLYGIVAVAVPGAAGIVDEPGFSDGKSRRALLRVMAVSALLLLSLVPYLLLRGMPRGVPPEAQWLAGVPRSTITWTTSRILAEYVRMLAFPGFLGTDFAYAARVALVTSPGRELLLSTLAWLPLVVGALLLLRRWPLPSAGVLWTFGALLPVLHVIPIGVLMAERLTYLPSAGFCIAAGAAIGSLRRTPLVVGLVAALVLALGVRSAVRAADWSDDLALWEAELPKAPRDVVVNNNLAVAYSSRAQYAKAIPPLETSIRVAPRYWRAHVNLGIAEQGLGRPERARAAYLEAIRIAPGLADPLYFYARFQGAQGENAAGVETLAAARRIAPEQARLATLQGQLLVRLGRVDEARAAFQS